MLWRDRVVLETLSGLFFPLHCAGAGERYVQVGFVGPALIRFRSCGHPDARFARSLFQALWILSSVRTAAGEISILRAQSR
jgi:hypothetical protein